MKNILLLGDSIRIGYDEFVKEKLEGKADVFFPEDNCRFAQYMLRYLGNWKDLAEPESVDIVHWNCGLWDILRMDGDEVFTPKEFYVHTIVRIAKKMKLFFPNARIIFALTTPVIESWGSENFMRYNSDIEEYNAAAIDALTPLGVEINDLYSTAAKFDESLRKDWTHFNDDGSNLLADSVVKAINI